MTEQEQLIADEQELAAFAQSSHEDRRLTDGLKGVLAETAVTGVIRYPWTLLQPLINHAMQEQLSKYEAEEHVEIGPARPILGGSNDSVAGLCERFSRMLEGFTGHPWTLQRLCELLLEPQKQYKRLHKLALAIEKLLLVTGELGVSEQLGPRPPLSQLTRINEAPPAAAGAAAFGTANRQGDSDGGGLVAAALDIRQLPQQTHAAQQADTSAAAAEAGIPPAAAGTASASAADAAPDPMQVDTAAGTADAGGHTAAAAAAAGDGDAVMEQEPPAAAAPPAPDQAEAAAAAGADASSARAAQEDAEMATEEAPAVTDHSHMNAVGGSSSGGGCSGQVHAGGSTQPRSAAQGS